MGTGSGHTRMPRGTFLPEEDRPTKVANMDHIGCGGSLKITLALTAARQHWWGAMCNQRNFRARFIPTILTLISDAVSSL